MSRQGALITWDVQEFLHRLGARIPLAQLRGTLRTHLHNAARSEGTA
ncbi:hypothetical protein [Sinosporangium siamense]|nr:hypothetical protein [Sinosporangium siamense]